MEQRYRKDYSHRHDGQSPEIFTNRSHEARELLCSMFAHEIANSLHCIYGVASCMEGDFNEPDNLDTAKGKSLKLIKGEINRLTLLLEDFRSCRLFSLEIRPISLAPVIEDCLALKSSETMQRGIRIEYDVPLRLPHIIGDAAKLKHVFLNLYSNAVDAMRDGGLLSVKAMECEENVSLEISDSGEGVPDGIQIFEPFVTNKPHGTGLGLAVVKWIVLAHGGTISYRSKLGEGTNFLLRFPVATSPDKWCEQSSMSSAK